MSKTCNGCGNTEFKTSIPFVAHESAMSRADRQNKRLWIVVILLVVLLMASNCAWLWYESQFEIVDTTEEIMLEADGDGIANFIGENGDIHNGKDKD